LQVEDRVSNVEEILPSLYLAKDRAREKLSSPSDIIYIVPPSDIILGNYQISQYAKK